MCCLNNLKTLLGVFERFVFVTHTKRREFLLIQEQTNRIAHEFAHIKDGHLESCTREETCDCKAYIYNAPKDLVDEIIDIINVPYCMNFGPFHYINRYTTCKYCTHETINPNTF